MKLNNLFPTTIAIKNDLNFTNKTLVIANEVFNQVKTFSTKFGYKNTFDILEAKEILYREEWLTDYIRNLTIEFINNIGYNQPSEYLIDLFVSHMKENDSHELHHHPQSSFSGVCYLEVEPNSSPITFHDPRPMKHFNFLTKSIGSIYNETEKTYYPAPGDILIWESWIYHSVPKNSSPNRKTLVFNVAIK